VGEFAERQSTPVGADAPIVKEISGPLYEAKGWMKFLGVILIVYGAVMVLTIWGIIFCWLPIWMGILLLNAGKSVEAAHQSGNKGDFVIGMGKLKTFFTIYGILALIGIVLMIIVMAVAGGAMMNALRSGAFGARGFGAM
jgi:hypothetical protein